MPLQKVKYSFYNTNASGVTHHKVYVKQGSDFVGTGVPDDSYLDSILKLGTNIFEYQPKSADDYYFRFYSYNSDNRKISSSYTSTSVSVTGSQNQKDYKISSLRIKKGGHNYVTNSIKSGDVFDTEPEFSWQIGNHDPEALQENVLFRITTRPISNTSTPSSHIYYEITGYRPNIRNPKYVHSYQQVIGSSGDGTRSYDIVIETHDRTGATSAGNTINGPKSATETWSHTNGFDKISIFSNKPTGIWLTTGDETYNGYRTKQWIDGERNLHIEIISGKIPRKIVGARLYYSINPFTNSGLYDPTGGSISSGIGQSGVGYANINFSDYNDFYSKNHFYAPTNIENTGHCAVSYYDIFDLEIYGSIENCPHIDISPVVPIYSTGSYHILSVFNTLKIHNTGDENQHVDIQYRSPIGASGYHTVYMTDKNNEDIIINTFED